MTVLTVNGVNQVVDAPAILDYYGLYVTPKILGTSLVVV